ncbi:hypothetical protein D3C80_1636400 [compost metagenome]
MSGISPSTPWGVGKIRRMATTNRMIPPAIPVASRDRPSPVRMCSPRVRNSSSRPRASSNSRSATFRRRSAGTDFSAARNTAMLPNGSVIRKIRMATPSMSLDSDEKPRRHCTGLAGLWIKPCE